MIRKVFDLWVVLTSLLLLQCVCIPSWALIISAPEPHLVARGILPDQVEDLWQSLDFWKEIATLGDTARNFTEHVLEEASQTYTEASSHIIEFRNTIEELVHSVASFREEHAKGINLDDLSDSLSVKLDEMFQSYQTPLDKAPTHDERKERIGHVLGPTEQVVFTVLASTGVPQDKAHEFITCVHPHIEGIMITTGDLVELHPELLDLIIFAGSVLILPEVPILRPILRVFGFGPTGPVKGSFAAWAQQYFFGKAVTKGSWFSSLQRWAMTGGKKGLDKAVGWITGVVSTL